MSYVFLFTFFHCRSFSPYFIGGRKHFSFHHRRYKIFFFKSPSSFFSLSLAGLAPSFSFCLSFSCSICQICGHDNLSELNTLGNTDTEKISAFRFRLYWLFCCLCFTRRRFSRQDNLELHFGCHTCWLSYFTLVCLWCGRTVSRAVGQ